MKDKLSGKITSEEALVAAAGSVLRTNLPDFRGDRYIVPWWYERERLRLHEGVYQTTDLLDCVNARIPHVFAHVSTVDPELIAYTPDAAAGEADRQLTIALGRFLRKYYPLLPDEKIRDLVADHKAELSNEVEFLSGEDIAKAYDETSATSCMAGKKWTVNPLQAYDAPNIRMAVLRDPKGVINARCMVYEPSETDKRMIRCYGDSKLHKRLSRLGYRSGIWAGAKFKTIEVSKGEGVYAMPYLDGSGTSGGSHSYVALIDGVITALSPIGKDRIVPALGTGYAVSATNTSGRVILKPVESGKFLVKDVVTGCDINLLTDEATNVYYNVAVGVTTQDVSDWPRARPTYGRDVVPVHPDTPTFTHPYGGRMVDTAENRASCGYKRLDETLYPDGGWSTTAITTTSGKVIRRDDLVLVADAGEKKYYHTSEVQKSWIKLHKTMYPAYAATKADFVKTKTGRKVSKLIHEVSTVWNGDLVFSRGVREVYALDKTWYYTKDLGEPTVDAYYEHLRSMPLSDVKAYAANHTTYCSTPNGTVRTRYATPAQIVAMIDSTWRVTNPIKAIKKYLELWIAEAEAVEFPSPALVEHVQVEVETEEMECVA